MLPDPVIQSEVLSYLGQLPVDAQARVASFARDLVQPNAPKKVGVPGKDLLKFAGTIPHEDCVEMLKAIEEDCEQIDHNEW
jgi:hypothetical protein